MDQIITGQGPPLLLLGGTGLPPLRMLRYLKINQPDTDAAMAKGP